MKFNNNFLKFLYLSLVLLMLSSATMYAQQGITVTGKVTEQGDPLPGVTITVKGNATIGTATDINGVYTLSVPDANTVLVFSYIGFVPQEIAVGNQRTINVSLLEDSKNLEEVVVIGYGTQKKESLVGAVSQVKGETLVRSGTGNVSQTLAGRVPGMVTIMQTGLPGDSDPAIFIRGLASFTGNNQPLVMVDGIERSMGNIDPSEVETISVLKDASATAVFGVKGGNGVILITTKRGQEGRMEITVNADATMKQSLTQSGQEDSYNMLMARNQVFRNQQSWARVMDQSIVDRYRTRQGPWDEYLYPNVDHWDLNTKDVAWDERATISARGGTKFTKYYLMLGYNHETDLFKSVQTEYPAGYNSSRINFRMNYDFDMTKSTRFSISIAGFRLFRTMPSTSGNMENLFREFFITPPHTPYLFPKEFVEAFPDPKHPDKVYDRLSYDHYFPGFPLAYVRQNYDGIMGRLNNRINSDLTLNQKLDFITKGLQFQASFSYNNNSQYGQNVWGNYAETWDFVFTDPNAADYQWIRYYNNSQNDFTVPRPPFQRNITRRSSSYDYNYNAQFMYNRLFPGEHNVSALARFQRRIAQTNADFPLYEESWAVRGAYDYKAKYLFEFTLGITGSARFAPSNRFGYFPSGAIGWNIAREEFFKNTMPEQISNLKARYNYGVVGADNVSGYLYISEYTNWNPNQYMGSNNTGLYLGGFGDLQSLPPVVREGQVPNVNAQWERAQKHSLGFDLGLFNNSLNASVDFFSEYRDRILMSRNSISSLFGQDMRQMNLGEVKRHGMEIELNYTGRSNDWTYWSSLNYNFNENRIIKQDIPYATPPRQNAEGKPIRYASMAHNTGKYYTTIDQWLNYSLQISSQKSFGRDIIYDYDGNGMINSDDNLPTKMIERPAVTYGWSGGFSYKQFELSFLFQGQTSVWRNFSTYADPMTYINNENRYVLWSAYVGDIWTPTNQDAPYGTYGMWSMGNKSWRDGSYFRLKQLEIAYRFEKDFLKKVGLKSARIALQGYNVLTWTAAEYIFGDPESENNSSDTSRDGSYTNMNQLYPLPKRYTLALRFDF